VKPPAFLRGKPFRAFLLGVLLCAGADWGVGRTSGRFWHPFTRAPGMVVLEGFRRADTTFDLVALGTSRTNSAFSAGYLEELAGREGHRLSAFNLSTPGAPLSFFRQVFAWIRERDQAPKVLLVEIDPLVLSVHGRFYRDWIRFHAPTPRLVREIFAGDHLSTALSALAGGMGQLFGLILEPPGSAAWNEVLEKAQASHGDRYGPLSTTGFPAIQDELGPAVRAFRRNPRIRTLEARRERPLSDAEVLVQRTLKRKEDLRALLAEFEVPHRVRGDLIALVRSAQASGTRLVFFRTPLSREVFPSLYTQGIERTFRDLKSVALAEGSPLWLDTGVDGLSGGIRSGSIADRVQGLFRDGVDHLGGEGCRVFTRWLHRQLVEKGVLP